MLIARSCAGVRGGGRGIYLVHWNSYTVIKCNAVGEVKGIDMVCVRVAGRETRKREEVEDKPIYIS